MSKSTLFALNTIDPLENPDETHYIGYNNPVKVSYFIQLALESQQHQGKGLQGPKQSIAHCSARYKPLNKPARDTHSQAYTLR